RRRSRHRRHLPKSEIPIAIACGPRVPSSGTFVRLPAPETLHENGTSAVRALHHGGDEPDTMSQAIDGARP
ncbi:hypothetical protein, partial [Mesorhizobium sp. M6A.T.Ce.TU.016.01.1.1]|uniref:hypothetical protein n=1 Tax=Mesorhizobium sp. M6A.T.Ce.TU.016.01.1.1 TaxID=2496783 RepID=UPI001AEC8C76